MAQTSPQAGMAKDELLELLQRSRAQLLNIIAEAAKFDLNQLSSPHPFLGEFNLYQWFLFTGAHEHRHRRQIRGILENLALPNQE
jgi:hypothetical protein